MAFTPTETIDVGTTANDGTGDQLRTAFQKTNTNFTDAFAVKAEASDVTDILAGLGTVARSYTPATSVGVAGDLAGQIAYDTTYFYVCTADFDGVSNIWYRVAIATTW